MDTLFENEFIIIKIDLKQFLQFLLYWEWTSQDENFSDDEFLEHYRLLLAYTSDYECQFLLENVTQSLFTTSVELQERFSNEILGNIPPFVSKMAVVSANDEIVSLSNEQCYETLETTGNSNEFQLRYFSSTQEAREWIELDKRK
jgi:hypothetical protein